MFRPVRRKKGEIPREQAQAVLRTARWGVLAMQGDDGYPHAVPINFLYDEKAEKIYFHGAKAGYKVDAIRENDKVCFTACGPEVVKKEAWAPFVKSAVVYGRCRLLESTPENMAHLKQMAMKYYPDEISVDRAIASDTKGVQMFVIEIEHLTGKEVQEK